MKSEKDIEALLKSEVKEWGEEAPSRNISLEALRNKAQALNTAEREAIEREVAELFPVQVITPEHKTRRPWRRYVAGLVAACMLFVLAPTMVRGSVDLPGIGVYIQEFALRHVGLQWAFDNGYMQGTVDQVSKNGVTLKILGVIADPVETTIIYLLQGVDESAIKESGTNVYIPRVDGEGAGSWTSKPVATSVGFVGTSHTKALPNSTGTIEVEVRLPSGSKMGLTIPVSREEISKLAEEVELNFAETIEGITVKASKVVLTPTQLMVEYSISGGHNIWGSPPQDLLMHLLAGGVRYNQAAGTGGSMDTETNTWQLRSVFVRPKSLSDVLLVIPALSKTLDAELEWQLAGSSDSSTSDGRTLEIYDIRTEVEQGENLLKFGYTPSNTVWSPKDLTVIYQDGSSEKATLPREYWSGDGTSQPWAGFGIPIAKDKTPMTLRADKVEVIVLGEWIIPIINR